MSADTDETHQVGKNSSTSLQMLHFKGWTTMGFLNGAGFRGWRRPSTTRWVASVTGSERSGGQSSAGRASLPSPRRWCDSAVGGCAIQSVSQPRKSTSCRVISHFINLKTRFRIQERFPSLQLCFGKVRKSHNIHVELLYTMIPIFAPAVTFHCHSEDFWRVINYLNVASSLVLTYKRTYDYIQDPNIVFIRRNEWT